MQITMVKIVSRSAKNSFYPIFNNCEFNWQINFVTSFTNTPCLHAQVLRGEAYDVWTIINLRWSISLRRSRSCSVATGVWSGHFLVRHLWIRIKSYIDIVLQQCFSTFFGSRHPVRLKKIWRHPYLAKMTIWGTLISKIT